MSDTNRPEDMDESLGLDNEDLLNRHKHHEPAEHNLGRTVQRKESASPTMPSSPDGRPSAARQPSQQRRAPSPASPRPQPAEQRRPRPQRPAASSAQQQREPAPGRSGAAQTGSSGAAQTGSSGAAQTGSSGAAQTGNSGGTRQIPVQRQRPIPVKPAPPVNKPSGEAAPLVHKRPESSLPEAVQKQPSELTVQKKPEAPAYASRRQTAAQSSSTPADPGGTKQSAAMNINIPADKKKGSTKAGADMMVSIVKAIIYMVLVLVVSVFISVFAIRIGNDVFAFVKSEEEIEISVPENADTDDIADILYDNGIIKYPGIFKLYASLKHEKGDYLAGDYTVTPSMSYDKLRAKFKKQVETGTCWITIPEGYTTDEIIDLMVENGIGERDKYIDVINNYDFDYWFIDELEQDGISKDRAYRLDGYLFPDSYQFYKASSEVTVINRLLARFDEVFVKDYEEKAKQLGFSVDEILTLASMIEKEAGTPADFMYVSSAFRNRLNDSYNFSRLQSDATIVYAIQIDTGTRPKEITHDDISYDNPYNTYLYDGLPPGPITNPSASAIRYALYPANTDYKYFVSADNGITLFAATRPEHEANIEKVKQMNADNK